MADDAPVARLRDDPPAAIGAEIAYLRLVAGTAAIDPGAFDFAVLAPRFDRALGALEAVLKAHRNAGGRCAWCRNPDGQRVKWPCGEWLAISRELTGKAADDAVPS